MHFLQACIPGRLTGLLATFCACSVLICSLSADDRKPNVVIFFTDDQGTLDANCFGSDDLYTPAIDQLAATGVRFTQAYAHTVCCPARAMLMTGRYPQRSNVNIWTQSNAKDEKGRNMFREEVTLAEVLRDSGYRTALFGKWHLGAHPDHGPREQGFDEFFGLRGGFIDNYNHFFLHRQGFHDLYEGTEEVFMRGDYFPDLMTDRAVRFVDENKDSPFLLYVAFNIPHYPEQADEKFDDRYQDLEMPRQAYAKMISTTDDRIGQIMKRLDHHGLTEDTIVVFMSDNGHSTEDYQIQGANHTSGLPEGSNYGANGGGGNTGKWLGQKGTFLEGGIRVPAILSYPAAVPKGIVRDQAITAMDWMPTILELCEIEPPEVELDGRSLLPVIESESAESPHTVLHWQWGDGWAVREGDWKLIGKADRSLSLGNLSDPDPEKKNYLEQKPVLAKRLQTLHKDWQRSVQPEEKTPPNIVFLMADDLGYGDTGFNGNEVIQTPHLDAMAREGIRFTRFYSIGPVCGPTRASALTGRHYMRFGMMHVNMGKLPEQEITLARASKSKGYSTGHFGKWHLGSMSRTESPRHRNPAVTFAPPWERDYDDAFATEISCPTWNPASGRFKQHNPPYWHNGKKVTGNLGGDDSRVIMDRVIPFIQNAVNSDTPFLTTVWFHTPHSPVVAGPDYLKMYQGHSEGRQHYYGCITAMDEQIGRLREELKRMGIEKDTLMFFCSDNGPEGDGNPTGKYDAYRGAFHGSAGELRGRKRSLYEGGVRVPAVAVWPGTVAEGRTVDMPCSTLDYLPTISEMIGFDYPDERPLDGESLLPLLLDRADQRNSFIPFASNIEAPRAAIISGEHKLLTNFSKSGDEDALYHVHKDSGESKNLISSRVEMAKSMKTELRKWVESCRDSFDGKDYAEPYEPQGIFLILPDQ